ncbi:MDR family oxidoreductase [Aeromicrobium choanae]|uniref:Acrylyl-CoA reductase (NADPH) n=1 Tax=Aeromicrobium choanae TaxID=1736691 RepID=A0A1T4YT98_9ACTN|nr:MDR family oxidoreductase [Aeromicrobium choanae]SKB04475.1 acrylyl-CoA reductase (NADPH) [Aeromicrobium choanae]
MSTPPSKETQFTALVVDEAAEGRTAAAPRQLTLADLPDLPVLVEVEYSSLNYKDGLNVSGAAKIARRTPLVAGIDLAGVVVESADPNWSAGDRVVVNGWGLSETQSGGYTRYQRVKPEWLVRLPDAFTTLQAMAIGTAGYTAALCVDRIVGHGTPAGSEVLVTGAAGGVGSFATALATAAGYRVIASTGRSETHEYLTGLGARSFIDRSELQGKGRALGAESWAAAIDSVGGSTLVNAIARTQYGGAVAACGMAESPGLPDATVMPHILRSVALLGVDSVMAPAHLRAKAWERLERDLPDDLFASVPRVEPLSTVPALAREILAGQVRGRVVVDVTA